MNPLSSDHKREASIDASRLRESLCGEFGGGTSPSRFERVPVGLGVLGRVVGRQSAWVLSEQGLPDKVRAFVASCEASGLADAAEPTAHLQRHILDMIASPRTSPAVFRGALVLELAGLLPDIPRADGSWAVYLASPEVATPHATCPGGMSLAEKFSALLEDGSELYETLFEPMGAPLIKAIQADCVEALAAMIAAGVNLEATCEGWTPLHAAAQANAPRALAILLRAGASVNAVEHNGLTPLHMAVIHGSAQFLTALLTEPQVDVNGASLRGGTAMHYAVTGPRPAVIEELVRAGARLDPRLNDGRTPLHLAVDRRNMGAVMALLNLGANPNVVDRYGASPLHIAASKGEVGMVRALLDTHADLGCRMHGGVTAVDFAAQSGSGEVLCELFRRGAVPTARALNAAVRNGCAEVVRVLTREMIRRGENVNPPTRSGVSPLHIAAGRGDAGMVQALLDAGADVNALPQFDLRSVRAYQRPGQYVLRLHVQTGARFRASPLQLAAGNGHAGVVRALLVGGARIDGTRPSYLAMLGWSLIRSHGGQRIAAASLQRAMALPPPGMAVADPLEIAIRRGHESVVRTLIAHGADVARSSRQSGRSMLNLAVHAGREPVLAALLESGQITDRAALEEALRLAQDSGKAALAVMLSAALSGAPNPEA